METENAPFKIGDVVCLNSGGPPMTVSFYDPLIKTVYVNWIMGQLHNEKFNEKMVFIFKGTPESIKTDYATTGWQPATPK